jgi:hypothetical protein
MLNKNKIDKFYFSKEYEKFLENLNKIQHFLPDDYPIDDSLAKYIFQRRKIFLRYLFENYTLIHKKVYINKKIKEIIDSNNKSKFMNFYFLINEKGYIPSLNTYESYLLSGYLKYKTKKKKIYIYPFKAVFFDRKINYSSHIFLASLFSEAMIDLFLNL